MIQYTTVWFINVVLVKTLHAFRRRKVSQWGEARTKTYLYHVEIQKLYVKKKKKWFKCYFCTIYSHLCKPQALLGRIEHYQQAFLFTAPVCLKLQAGTLVFLFFSFHLFLQCLVFRAFLFFSYLIKKKKQKPLAYPASIALVPWPLNINSVLLRVTIYRLISICQVLGKAVTSAHLYSTVSSKQGSSSNYKVHFMPLLSFMWICLERKRPHLQYFFVNHPKVQYFIEV